MKKPPGEAAETSNILGRTFKRETGAGDGIRTHDPNLGKVVLYP
jgi:hypothetical protein